MKNRIKGIEDDVVEEFDDEVKFNGISKSSCSSIINLHIKYNFNYFKKKKLNAIKYITSFMYYKI